MVWCKGRLNGLWAAGRGPWDGRTQWGVEYSMVGMQRLCFASEVTNSRQLVDGAKSAQLVRVCASCQGQGRAREKGWLVGYDGTVSIYGFVALCKVGCRNAGLRAASREPRCAHEVHDGARGARKVEVEVSGITEVWMVIVFQSAPSRPSRAAADPTSWAHWAEARCGRS